jgi:hypothetical protein
VSTCPCWAVPEILGKTLLTGAALAASVTAHQVSTVTNNQSKARGRRAENTVIEKTYD